MISTDDVSPHRLFAAIVLMGTGLATGCGGIASSERHESPSSAGAGGSATSAAGGAGGAGYVGGGPTIPLGDIVLPEVGGATSLPDLGCPTEQWICESNTCSGWGWQVSNRCKCGSARPVRASDCHDGQVFACMDVRTAADGRPLATPAALSCACVDEGMGSCTDACQQAYGIREAACDLSADARSVLCGCAIVLLK